MCSHSKEKQCSDDISCFVMEALVNHSQGEITRSIILIPLPWMQRNGNLCGFSIRNLRHKATDRNQTKDVFLALKQNICLKRKDLFLLPLPQSLYWPLKLRRFDSKHARSSQADTVQPKNNPDHSDQVYWILMSRITGWTQCYISDHPQRIHDCD